MNKKFLLAIILSISAIAFSTGFYLKFLKSYSDNKLQIEKTYLFGEKPQRNPRLGEMIKLMSDLENSVKETRIKADKVTIIKNGKTDSNKITLERLKFINYTSISLMIISIITIGLTFKRLLITTKIKN